MAGIGLLLSLASFQYGHPAHNWLGMAGYVMGGVLTYTVGLSSYLIATLLSWVGWRHVRQQPLPKHCLLYSVLLILSASLFAYHPRRPALACLDFGYKIGSIPTLSRM